MRFIGCDLGTKRGAIYSFQDNTVKKESSWLRGPRVKDFLDSLGFLENKVLTTIVKYPDSYMGFDWSPYEVFIRGHGALATNVKSFMMGYLLRTCSAHSVYPIIVPPSVVRAALLLGSNQSKSTVHDSMARIFPSFPWSKLNEHEIDALAIALTTKKIYELHPNLKRDFPLGFLANIDTISGALSDNENTNSGSRIPKSPPAVHNHWRRSRNKDVKKSRG